MALASSITEGPHRVLILAPTGRDGEVLVRALAREGLDAEACASMVDLCQSMVQGADGAIIASEALTPASRRLLERTLHDQPEWSDFPLVLMATPRGGSHPHEALPGMGSLSSAAVLVRPVHAQTLVSAVRAALRSRARQYQVRDELIKRRRAESELRESNERKDEFLAMLGHELRNPLAAIRHATQLMNLSPSSDERLVRVCEVLDRQSVHMTRLVDGLLEVSRISRGKIRLDSETLDVRLVLEATLRDHMDRVEDRGLELKMNLPSEPLWLWADRSRLAQVFDNLVGNAIKFTEAPGTISVSLTKEDQRAVVRVRDSGVGIRPEMLERLFEPFQQAEQDMARASGGLGLGLALAKGLVELHGGSTHARSGGPGLGAEFEVRLPLGDAPVAASRSAPRAQPAPRHILVVEDNADAGHLLGALLEALGQVATVVETGSEAMELLNTRRFDVVLCDLGLPGMSGYDLARLVRQDSSLRELRLVAVTGYGQPEDRRRTAEAGFDEHLTKPVELDDLRVVLDGLG